MTINYNDSELVDGRLYKKITSFEKATELMNYIYEKGIETTDFGCYVHDSYYELYPKPKTQSIDYSMLDHY